MQLVLLESAASNTICGGRKGPPFLKPRLNKFRRKTRFSRILTLLKHISPGLGGIFREDLASPGAANYMAISIITVQRACIQCVFVRSQNRSKKASSIGSRSHGTGACTVTVISIRASPRIRSSSKGTTIAAQFFLSSSTRDLSLEFSKSSL